MRPILKKEVESGVSQVESTLLRHLYTKNINSLFSRVIHGTTRAHSIEKAGF
jgi:hypothetical protein